MSDLTPISQARFGWLPDRPDIRDYGFKAKLGEEVLTEFPVRAIIEKFRDKIPVVDQGNIGSCVGNSTAALMAFVRGVVMRSRLQIYYEARRLQGWENEDTGAFNRDAMKVIATLGAGRESWWPYDPTKFTIDPLEKVDRDGLKRKIFSYYRLEDGQAYRSCLAQGFPFIIGATLYTRFLGSGVAKHGIVNWPRRDERVEGGHSFVVYGYDDNFRESEWAKQWMASVYIPERAFICRNSWDKEWGRNGDFAIDADYLEHPWLADDAWTCRRA
jgi:hypothetical protein